MAQVLIVEDDNKIGRMLERITQGLGHHTLLADTLSACLTLSRANEFDLVLLDLSLPDGNGLSVLPELSNSPSQPEIIIITGTGDQSGAEVAFKSGAWDFVSKPFLPEEIALAIARALEYRQEKRSHKIPRILHREAIVGDSPKITACLELVARAAVTDVDVLVTGETGTGKELFAQAIHKNSPRTDKPFIVVDCASHQEQLMESTLFGHVKGAFTGANSDRDGLVKQADKGTLFLDEVGELSLPMQKIFLRVLQERTFRPIGATSETTSDFRLIAATNRNLDKMIADGQFRLDLLHRLRSIEINLPPLREHIGDLEQLVAYYLQKFRTLQNTTSKGVSAEFINNLKSYDWPGNIRELFNTLDYALANAGNNPTLYPVNLTHNIRMSKFDTREEEAGIRSTDDLSSKQGLRPLKELRESVIEEFERTYLTDLMRETKGRIKDACRIAELSESRLHALLKKYHTPKFR